MFGKYIVKMLPVALLLLVTQIACTSLPHRLEEREEAVGTTGEDDWLFHRIVEEPYALGLHFPGYLVAIENTSRKDTGIDEMRSGHPLQLNLDDERLSHDDREKLKSCLDNRRRAFLSHIFRYSLDSSRGIGALKPETVYSAYGDLGRDDIAAVKKSAKKNYERGADAIEQLRVRLRSDIEANNVTHLFLYSIGWNTDQQEALRNYNSLHGNILEIAASDTEEQAFRPLVVGLTWDSVLESWFLSSLWSAASYPNKANHADEIGAIWGNLLLRNVLVPLKLERETAGHRLNLVLVGHSFGARVLTRALFSYPLLAQTADDSVKACQVDLVIGLQGAFSVNRFIEHSGKEGSPYGNFPAVAKKFVFTWSKYDTANPLAQKFSQAAHIGGVPGHERTLKFPYKFEQVVLDDEGKWVGESPSCDNPNRVSIVDASEIAKHATFRKGGGAHSDIYSRETAQFIWNLLKDCTGLSRGCV